jgi:hypothetical protein
MNLSVASLGLEGSGRTRCVRSAMIWELYSITSRGCTCVRIREVLLTVINSCVLNSECNKVPL